MNKLFRKRPIFRTIISDWTTLEISLVDNRDGTVTASVSPAGDDQQWLRNGESVATGNPATFAAVGGDTIACGVLSIDRCESVFRPEDSAGGTPEPELPESPGAEIPEEPSPVDPDLEPPVIEPPVAPTVAVAAAFEPAMPVEGETVVVRHPVFAGTEPLDVTLESLTLGERDVSDRLITEAGESSLTTDQFGELRATWTAENAAGRVTTTATATVSRAPASADLVERLSISAHRTSVVEGEGVYFRVEGLSREETGTWGFKWDMDDADAGDWPLLAAFPEKVRDRKNIQGPAAAYAWETSGTKKIRCKVIPPSWSGLRGLTLATEVTIQSQASKFDAEHTWIVDPSGQFTDAPSGNQTTSLGTAHSRALRSGGGLILLANYATHNLGGPNKNFDMPYVEGNTLYYDSFGPGDARARIDVSVNAFNHFSGVGDVAPAVVFRNVELFGGYDPVTGNGARTNGIRYTGRTNLTLNNVKITGCKDGVQQWTGGDGGTFLIDTEITSWENFGYYGSPAILCVTGTRVHQAANAVKGYEMKDLGKPGNQPDHGPFRIEKISKALFWSNTGFCVTGWSAHNRPGIDSYKDTQPYLRAGSLEVDEIDPLIFLGNNYIEGEGFDLFAGNGSGIGGVGLFVKHGNYILNSAASSGSGCGHTGVWDSANIEIVPDVPKEIPSSPGLRAGSNRGGFGGQTEGWASGTYHLSGNTLAYMRSAESDLNDGRATLDDLCGETGKAAFLTAGGNAATNEGNLIYVPNQTLTGEIGPLVPEGGMKTDVWGPKPEYEGMRHEQADGSILFRPEHATPADAAILPLPVSNVTYAPSEHVHALDFFGNVRPATPTIGAVELAPLDDPDW